MARKNLAFSLIEMVIALAILATVTTIAIRATSGLQGQARYQASIRELNDLQTAIVGPTNQRSSDNSALVTGFVADTGRLPQIAYSPIDLPVASADPFNELLALNTIPAYQVLTSATDSAVRLGVGWQGPYMRLSAGPSFIRDGWGHSFSYTIGNPPTGAVPTGTPTTITSQGSGASDVYNTPVTTSIPATGFGGSYASFIGQVSMNIGADPGGPPAPTSGPSINTTYSSPVGVVPAVLSDPVTIWVCYFGPDCNTANVAKVFDYPVQVSAPDWRFTINATQDPRITIGPRALKAYVIPTSAIATPGDQTQFRTAVATGKVYAVTSVNVTALGSGQNINLVLPHYYP